MTDFLPDAPVTPPAMPARASGRGLLIAALVVAVLGVLGLTAMTSYLWNVHSQYVAQNEELRDVAESLGTDVASLEADAEQAQSELDETLAQLDTAKDTINDLANSEAQAGDDRQALVDVAKALVECADARQDLVDHLNEASLWTPESLRAREQDLTDFCDDVKRTYNEVVGG